MSQLFRLAPFWRVILQDLDLSAQSLVRRAGLPENLFASGQMMVDVVGWSALWNALDAEVDDPLLALRLGEFLTLDTFNPALFAAFCSEHLQQAACRLQLYKRLLGPFRLEVDDRSGLALSCHVEGLLHPPVLLGAVELALWVRLARHATRHPVVPKQVTMPNAPRAPAAFEALFGIPVTLGERYEIVFRAQDAKLPFLTTDASMWTFLEPVLSRRLADLDERTPMSDRVIAALHELLPSGRSQIGDVARALGVSTRTVQRRLGQENTTFRGVLDKTRSRLAQHYLQKTQLTIAEVAFLIGYDDPNSFYPAFRSWTGMTPQAARVASRAQDHAPSNAALDAFVGVDGRLGAAGQRAKPLGEDGGDDADHRQDDPKDAKSRHVCSLRLMGP